MKLNVSLPKTRRTLVQVAALTLMVTLLAAVWIVWPAVRFLYRERSLAESVRKYSETSGIVLTADDDVRAYLVKLAQHHRLNLTEGDVEIDYKDSPEAFGVPTRIGYTLTAQVDFHGLRVFPLLAHRSFIISAGRTE
ncbi:MAG: hypothetical protein RLZZ488_33 [Pseudomonadota bacterium]|jgi:hypothetical protein